MHTLNTFITLTYRNSTLPYGGDLNREDFQLFMKRLRKYFAPTKLRFFMCGEYGTDKLRPHYHAIIFGVDFPDKKFKLLRNEIPVHTSEILTNIWGKGRTEIGSVTAASAGYVARYTIQKQKENDTHLHRIIPGREEVYVVQKPYNNSSNRPGIGYDWYQKYKKDVFPDDFVINEKKQKQPTPGYYRVLLQREDPELYESLRKKRIEKSVDDPNNTPERLAVREVCKQKQVDRLARQL